MKSWDLAACWPDDATLCAIPGKLLLFVRPGGACLTDPCYIFLQAGDDEGMDPAFLGSRKSQKYGVDLSAAATASVRSGDADLPTKAPLHERRAKFDQVQLVISLSLSHGDPSVNSNGAVPVLWWLVRHAWVLQAHHW